jgi:hypothetical protein
MNAEMKMMSRISGFKKYMAVESMMCTAVSTYCRSSVKNWTRGNDRTIDRENKIEGVKRQYSNPPMCSTSTYNFLVGSLFTVMNAEIMKMMTREYMIKKYSY